MGTKITKKKYLKACDKYPPNWWIKIMFKYFSKSTTNDNLKPRKFIIYLLFILFFLGAIGTILKLPHILIGIITISYSMILILLGLSMLLAHIMNNFRLNKIRKELGVDKNKFNEIVDKYN